MTRRESWHGCCLIGNWNRNRDEKMNPHRIIEAGKAIFEAQVLRSHGLVIAAFLAPWSRPCQILNSVLDEVAAGCETMVKVVKVNADDNPDLSLVYNIQSVPTLLFFLDGSLCAELVGTASKEAILARLQAVSRSRDQEFHMPTRDQEHEHHPL